MRINTDILRAGAGPSYGHSSSAKVESSPEDSKRGALVIIDSFESSASHGHHVEASAQSLGATGPTYRFDHRQQVDGRTTMPHVTAYANLQANLASAPLPADQAAQQLDTFVIEAAGGNLELVTSLLKTVQSEGFENSVVNISQGLDSLTLLHLAKLPVGPKSKLSAAQQAIYRSNVQAALQAEPSATEQQSDNRLLQRIKTVLHQAPQVQQAVSNWREQVRSFESDHNSVVVAAGNAGQTQKALAAAGFTIDGSEDFNILSVPEVTTVGASVATTRGISLMAASSFGPEVDIIADGQYERRLGTSYASPRVANAMRAAHQTYPEFTSDQAEQWVKTSLADQAQIGSQSVALLDSQRASRFLQIASNDG